MVLGIAVLGLTLADVFLTALNYDEAGYIAGRVAAWQWSLTRRVTRRISRRWRPVVLRQITGLQVMMTVFVWVGGVILGYGLIYLGSMQGKAFLYDGVHADFFGAVYFSAAQLSTVGTSQLTPNTDVLRALSILETLTGVVLVSMVLTFLLGVYDVISSLRALSAQLFSGGRGIGEPIDNLRPYFPHGEARDLDSYLDSVAESFVSYVDGVRLHHAAYYFQSGRDTFALPYAVRMLGGTIGALRWGLPRGHPVTEAPTLLPLTSQFEKFHDYMHPLLNWTSTDVPETVPRQEFQRQIAAEAQRQAAPDRHAVRRDAAGDPWVARFAQLNRQMAELVHGEALADPDEAYERYTEWLPFAYMAQQFSSAVGHDLDYQPVYSADARTDDGDRAEADAALLVIPPPPAAASPRPMQRWRAFFSRRLTLIDPGATRLLGALRVLGAAAVTVIVLVAGLAALGLPPMPAAIFGGMIAMFTGGAAAAGRAEPSTHGPARFAGLLALLPVLLAVGLNSVVPNEPVASGAVLVLLAVVALLLGRFGPAVRGLGQLAFMSFYFVVLLRLSPDDFALYASAAVIGVLISVLIRAIPSPRAHARVVLGGGNAFELRIAGLLDPLIDTVSAARWDPDLRRRVQAELKQLHHSAAFFGGQLSGEDPDLGLSDRQLNAIRMRVFDTELAAMNLAMAARAATGAGMPVSVRALLSGELVRLQTRVRSYPQRPVRLGPDAGPPGSPPAPDSPGPFTSIDGLASIDYRPAPLDWPASARRLHLAIAELAVAAEALHLARGAEPGVPEDEGAALAESSGPAEHGGQPSAEEARLEATEAALTEQADEGMAQPEPHEGTHAPRGAFTVPVRRAVQAGLSTALALWAGAAISVSYQYWAALPAFLVLGGTDGETFVKGAQRVIGTVTGAAVGFGVALLLGANLALLLPVMALSVLGTMFFRSVSAPLSTFWQMVLLAQLYEVLGRLDTETIELRVLETVVGSAIALAVAALVLPIHTRTKLDTDTAGLVRTVRDVTTTCLTRLGGAAAASAFDRQALTRQELAMSGQLLQVQATAAPLRRASGALDVGGVEGRLTALWTLLFHTRQLVTATESLAPGDSTVSAEQWRQLQALNSDNFAALLAVLDGRQPAAVHEDVALADREELGESRAVELALHALERIDQTVLVLMENSQPEGGRLALLRAFANVS